MTDPFSTDFLVLAGGRGTRATHLPAGVPKFLAPTPDGRTVGYHLVRDLAAWGVSRILLGIAYGTCAGAILDYLPALYDEGPDIVPIVEPEPRGTVAALAFALPHLTTDPFVVVNGDTLLEVDFAALLKRASAPHAWAVEGVDFLTGAIRPTGVRVLSRAAADVLLLSQGQRDLERIVGWQPYLTGRRFLDTGTPEGHAALDAWFNN